MLDDCFERARLVLKHRELAFDDLLVDRVVEMGNLLQQHRVAVG